MTGSKEKPKMPDPIPPAQISVQAPDVSDKTVRRRRRGFLSTILAGGMNDSILKTGRDKLG